MWYAPSSPPGVLGTDWQLRLKIALDFPN